MPAIVEAGFGEKYGVFDKAFLCCFFEVLVGLPPSPATDPGRFLFLPFSIMIMVSFFCVNDHRPCAHRLSPG